MTKLRERAGGFMVVLLAFSFGGLWMLMDTGVFDTVGGAQPSGDIIVVEGEPVTVNEFNQAVDQQIQTYEAQTGRTVTPQVREQAREQAYNALVTDRLVQREMDRLDLVVTEDELYDLVYGPNPHPLIRSYFGDSTGQVNPQLLNSFFSNPEATQQAIQLENLLRTQRRQQKLTNLIGATVHVSEEDVQDAYRRQNMAVDVRYVALPYARVPNDSVTVTESDLSAYYDENREDYRRERTYTVSYVTMPKTATTQDTALVREELTGLRSAFAEAESDSLFLARNASARPYASTYFAASDLNAAVANAVFANLDPGTVVGPVFTSGMAHLIKIQDVRPADAPSVRARHILFQGADDAAARQQAEAVLDSLQAGADFAALARQYSDDPGSAAQGGALGWFGEGQMVEPFAEAAFDAPAGEVVGPVETQFGYHLIEVQARADQEVRLADYVLPLQPSIATLSDAQETLGDVAYYASQSGNLQEEAQQEGLQVQQTQIEAGQSAIPGLGTAGSVARFLDRAEEGDVSEVIELQDQFVVARVERVQEEGYRPFDEIQSELRPRVVIEKKRAVLQERMERALQGGGLEQLAAALGAQVRTQEGLSYTTGGVPGVGSDPAFIGTAMGVPSGQTSRVVTGENAAFVLEVTAANEPAAITEAERERLREQLQSQRRNQVLQAWITSLREEADIEDNRAEYLQ